ncbi:MAG: hypothetical protein U0R64_05965 [Candidatus Nanopelagicales bacterium]
MTAAPTPSPKKPATKAAAKKAPAKKAAGKKAPTKKAAAKKTPAKKPAAKKATTKKAATKKTTPRRQVATTTAPRRKYDLTLFGATGFTGQLVAKWPAGPHRPTCGSPPAGRDRGRVEQVSGSAGARLRDRHRPTPATTDRWLPWPPTRQPSSPPWSLRPVRAKPVVAACAAAGTHHCDLTGEVLFMRDSIDRYDEVARASGARMHSCGFDSIPSDLGVLALSLAATADDPEARLRSTRLVVTGMKGGVSGGTIASGLGEMERAGSDPTAARILSDPYSLSPDRSAEPVPGDGADPRGPVRDEVIGAWLAPFLMGPINSRVVRRSNALNDYAYGRDFRYAEYLATGDGTLGRLAAIGVSAGMATLGAAMSLEPLRAIAAKVMPEPGEGPDAEARAQGRFSIELHTRTTTGVPYRARVAALGDPGYAATAMMLATTGMALATADDLPPAAGVLTPATGLGESLITALKRAGMTLEARRV